MAATIALTPVDSSNLSAIGYDAATRTLRIEFKGGKSPRTYDYHDVPAETYAALQDAPSKGGFWASHKHGFSHSRVG